MFVFFGAYSLFYNISRALVSSLEFYSDTNVKLFVM